MQLRNLKQSYNELKSYNAVRGPAAAAQQNTTGVIGQQADRDELYKNRSSRKTDSQGRGGTRSSGSSILLKIVSENRFSGNTYFYTIADRINELQEEVRDLQVSLREFSTQLTSARADSDKHLESAQSVTFYLIYRC